MKKSDFIKQAGIPDGHSDEDRFSVQCCPDGRETPIRLDSSKLRDYRGAVTGNLLVFTEPDISTDILTGFENWEYFHRIIAEDPYNFDHPTAVAVFDIIGLSRVNHTFGHEVGNQRIRGLASAMRKYMPEGTKFVRGYEANLLAICQHSTENDIRENAEKIQKACGGTVMYGLSETADSSVTDQNQVVIRENAGAGRNVIQAVELAIHSLQVKKLLDSGSNHSQTLTSLVRALQESDSDTEAHVKRTQKMGNVLGKRIGLTDAEQADLSLLCLLHDIGKIGIPLEILNKPGRLTESEWAVLRTHAEKGFEIAMSSDELKDIAVFILHHHERWDGDGYPEKLAGSAIPLLSRIISVVDAYDAMVNTRSYRKALSPKEAQAEIKRCSGTQFDPMLAEEFLKMLDENPDITQVEKTSGEIRVFKQLEDPAVVYRSQAGAGIKTMSDSDAHAPAANKTGVGVADTSGMQTGADISSTSDSQTGAVTANQPGSQTGALAADQPGSQTGALAADQHDNHAGTDAADQHDNHADTDISSTADRHTGAVAADQTGSQTGAVAADQHDNQAGADISSTADRHTGAVAADQTGSQTGADATDTLYDQTRADATNTSGSQATPAEDVTNSVPFCHYILDIDDRIVEVDPMFTDITGFTPGEAIGNMTQFDLIPGDDRRHYISEVEEQFKHGNIAYLEHDIVRKDGTRVHVNCIGKRYYDSAAKAYRSEILVSRI